MELARNNRVFFLDPATPWSPRSAATHSIRARTLELSGMTLLQYANVLPLTRAEPLFTLNEIVVQRRLRAFLAERGALPSVVWSFDPFRLLEPRRLGPKLVIYHRVDDYRTDREFRIAQNADVVLCVTESLAARIRPRCTTPVHVVPHGVVDHGFSEDEVASLQPADEAILVGSLSWKTDWSLLLALAAAQPRCRLRLIGRLDDRGFSETDTRDVAALRDRANVEFVGAKAYPALFEDIRRARVCLSAYKPIEPAWQHSSLKIPLYLSFGKPVVCGPFTEYARLHPALLYMARTFDDFLSYFKTAWAEPVDAAARRERYRYAAELSYPKLLRTIEALLEQ